MQITGVKEVLQFNDNIIMLITMQGNLSIKGVKLHIDGFDMEAGKLTATGDIHALIYSPQKSKGFMDKIFK